MRETNLAAFCGPTSSGMLTSFYEMGGKQYVPKQIKHSIRPMKQSCQANRVNGTSGGSGRGDDGRRRGREIDAKERNVGKGGAEGGGTYATCSSTTKTAGLVLVLMLFAYGRGWVNSVCLFHFVMCAQPKPHAVNRITVTHPSGWTCWVGKQWAESAVVGLPFR